MYLPTVYWQIQFQEAIDKINLSPRFNENKKSQAIRIIKKLISTKSRKYANDEAPEARIDYISDHLGIPNDEVIQIITLLRDEKILADNQDLTAYIIKKSSETVLLKSPDYTTVWKISSSHSLMKKRSYLT